MPAYEQPCLIDSKEMTSKIKPYVIYLIVYTPWHFVADTSVTDFVMVFGRTNMSPVRNWDTSAHQQRKS